MAIIINLDVKTSFHVSHDVSRRPLAPIAEIQTQVPWLSQSD